MHEMIGWIGSILLALCAVPQVVMCIKQGHAKGVSVTFLLMWFFGALFALIYILPAGKMPLIVNYILSSLMALIIVFYALRPKTLSKR